jgi:hypothetical protein
MQCVAEASSGRLLTGASLVDANGMTGEVCSKFCASKGFKLYAFFTPSLCTED